MHIPSVMSHNFSRSPQAVIPRSSFDRSFGCKTTFDSGYLVPVYLDEALPGDTFNLKMTAFSRLATPLFPVMDNLYMDSHFFAIPYRLVWDNWQKFNGEQVNPGDSTDYLIPTMTSPAGGYLNQSLSDYFGIPTQIAGLKHSSLWHRAYNLVWNEWFRDENLQNSVNVPKGDGPDSPANFTLLRRGKRYDYFTSCLPWPQKGPSVELPLGATAPVVTNNLQPVFRSVTTGNAPASVSVTSLSAGTGGFVFNESSTYYAAKFGTQTGLQADLSDATAATINQLRQAFQIQKLYERDARGGTRYIEIIRSHFGVVSPDARLQRPPFDVGGELYAVPINDVERRNLAR